MAKGSRGGRRTAGGSSFGSGGNIGGFNPATAGTATPQQAQGIIDDLQNGGTINYNSYMTLTDDEKADAMKEMLKQGLPNFLDDSALQRLLYYTEIDGKPQVVSDNKLNTMQGHSLYRTVNDFYNSRTDVNYTGKEIYDQIVDGDFTAVSGKGGSAYGKGIYFASSYTGSTAYSRGTKGSLVMRAKLNGNARRIDYGTAYSRAQAEIRSGSKLGRVYSRLSSDDLPSVWAVNNGYNVITDSSYSPDYHVVLDRSALTFSSKTKYPSGTRW